MGFTNAIKGQKHRIESRCPYRVCCLSLRSFQPFQSTHISSMHFHISSMELTEEPPKKKNSTTIYIYNKTKTHLFILTAFSGSKFERTHSLNIIIDLFLYIFICLGRHLSILLFICFDNLIFVYVFILLFLSTFICLYFYSCTYFFICVYICLCSRKKI